MSISRRQFLTQSSTLGLGAATLPLAAPAGRWLWQTAFPSKRPPLAQRNFSSEAVEATIREVKRGIADPELAWLFENCFPNTLDTTVRYRLHEGKPDTFVITGDIPAMWLRDSSAQVYPYVPLAKADEKLRALLEGVIRRQTQCLLIDPYANAFNDGPGDSQWKTDRTAMKPELHERKYELDSLCYPVRLAHAYFEATGDTRPFDADWKRAMQLVLRTMREQQRRNGPGPYTFQRLTVWPSDTVPNWGVGNPVRPTGMVCSVFRPSDDSTIYLYLVPSNLFAVRALWQMGDLFERAAGDTATMHACDELAAEIQAGIQQHAVTEHLTYGKVYCFETDGYGNRLFMDDANIPSLLSLPYLGAVPADDPVYRNTRRFVLSIDNPYFFRGKAAEGIGGPHAGLDKIWPLAIVMRALTSTDDAEIRRCLTTLQRTHAGTGFMHEAFHKDDAANFTRPWFAWANTLFGELVWKLHRERPHLLA